MNWGWLGRTVVALVSPKPLPLEGCVKACSILGAWSGGAAALVLAVVPLTPGQRNGTEIQAAAGLVVLCGAVASWLWPPMARPFFLLVGLGLLGVVTWYPFFIVDALMHRHESGTQRFAHAPGALALGLAFGVRLLVDFGSNSEEFRSRIARAAGIAGMAIGGALDLFVVQRIITLF